MDNKGFAITSVIYGLAILGIMLVLILMSTLSSSRNNVKAEAERVEDFLLAVNQTEVTYKKSGEYKVPMGETGWYRIEVFGHKGCNGGANGAYATGIIYLEEETKLKIKIGNCEGNDINTGVYTNSNVKLIEAGRGIGTISGGTTVAYNKISGGGHIDLDNNTLSVEDIDKGYTSIDESHYIYNSENTSFISGYPLLCNSSMCLYNYNYIMDGLMLPGASSLSSGKVIIERLAETNVVTEMIPRKNKKYDDVKEIQVYSDEEIEAIYISYRNNNSTIGGRAKKIICNNTNCSYYLLTTQDSIVNVDDINVVFKNKNKNITNTTVKLISRDNNERIIFETKNDYGIANSPLGIHLSAYQPDSVVDNGNILSNNNRFSLHGNYYIIPVTSLNKVVSAGKTAADDSNGLKIEFMTGEARQKWSIDLINKPGETPAFPNITNKTGRGEYRIMELARFKALSLYYDENFPMNNVIASQNFNSLSRNDPQIWNIYPIGDGTYAIKTTVPSLYNDKKSGFIFGITDVPNGTSKDKVNHVVVGKAEESPYVYNSTMPTNIERFYLYSLDFSN